MHLKYRDLADAFHQVVELFHTGRALVEKTPSRYGDCIYHPEPITITYHNPKARVLLNPARDCNPFFHLYEALWMLAGRNDVAPLQYYVKRMAEFSDDGMTFNGAYGYRWRRYMIEDGNADYVSKHGGMLEPPTYVDQLQVIINHLRANPHSRRAVLSMWNVGGDLLRIDNSKDVCCNLVVMFALRTDPVCPTCKGNWTPERAAELDESPFTCPNCVGDPDNIFLPNRWLDMTVVNRSNDMIWGLFGANYVHFTFLQEYLAAHLGVQVGKYHHVTNNLHAYTNNWNPEEWLESGRDVQAIQNLASDTSKNHVPLVHNWTVFDRELKDFVDINQNPTERSVEMIDSLNWDEPFFRTVAQPMFSAFHHYKLGSPAAQVRKRILQIKDFAWKIAATMWTETRYKRVVNASTREDQTQP